MFFGLHAAWWRMKVRLFGVWVEHMFGTKSQEKGLELLLNACEQIRENNPHADFHWHTAGPFVRVWSGVSWTRLLRVDHHGLVTLSFMGLRCNGPITANDTIKLVKQDLNLK
jgi:hypothetical protein